MKPRNIGVNGKTRPIFTKGIEETEGIIKGDAKKVGDAVMKQNRNG